MLKWLKDLWCANSEKSMAEKTEVFKTIVNLASQVSRDSAMTPYSHLCTVICLPSLVGIGFSIYITSVLGIIVFVSVALIPIGLFAKAYSHFMKSNPDCLRSEKYLL